MNKGRCQKHKEGGEGGGGEILKQNKWMFWYNWSFFYIVLFHVLRTRPAKLMLYNELMKQGYIFNKLSKSRAIG